MIKMKSNKNKASDRIPSIEGPGLPPGLEQRLKARPFQVPEGYFDSLPARILQKTATSRQVIPIRPFPIRPILWASAAAILVILSFTFFLRSELLERKSQLISLNENTLHKIVRQNMDSTRVDNSNHKPAAANTPSTPATAASIQNKDQVVPQVSPSHKKFDQIVKTLEKEGISDEDIMLYLLDENIDPADLSN